MPDFVRTLTGETVTVDFKRVRKLPVEVRAAVVPVAFEVETLEGVMRGEPGDYLIEGVKGELYPCRPDIFEATYELVEG